MAGTGIPMGDFSGHLLKLIVYRLLDVHTERMLYESPLLSDALLHHYWSAVHPIRYMISNILLIFAIFRQILAEIENIERARFFI